MWRGHSCPRLCEYSAASRFIDSRKRGQECPRHISVVERQRSTSLREEILELRQDLAAQRLLLCFSLEPQVVTGTFDRQQSRLCRNHLDRAFQFFNRPKGIARAAYE